MREGKIEQSGTPAEIYNYPRTAFVADFVGSANLVSGSVLAAKAPATAASSSRTDGGNVLKGMTRRPTLSAKGRRCRCAPCTCDSMPRRPAATENIWPVTISRAVFLGDITQVHVDWGGRELIVRQTTTMPLMPGRTAFLSIDPAHCILLED